jgi:phosphoribosylformylglycinamidine synthase
MHAVAEAARNVACSGATPIGATNCLNFGSPEKPHIMWQFSQVIDGLAKACRQLEIPITGGNVSFYNETLGEGIYPTPVLGVVGVLEDVAQAVFAHFSTPGRAIVLLRGSEAGNRTDAELEFGSSEYAKVILGEIWGFPPALELKQEAALQKGLVEMIRAGLLESAHDCSDGGIAVALAEACFARGAGFEVNLKAHGLPPEFVLFGEDASRVVVSCDLSQVSGLEQIALHYGFSAELIGETTSGRVEIRLDGQAVVSAQAEELRNRYEGALQSSLESASEAVMS